MTMSKKVKSAGEEDAQRVLGGLLAKRRGLSGLDSALLTMMANTSTELSGDRKQS